MKKISVVIHIARIGKCGSFTSSRPHTGKAYHSSGVAKIDNFLSVRVLFPQGQVYSLLPRAPLFSEMTSGLKAFLEPKTHLSFGSC